MKLYKLTDYNGKTRAGEDNELQWGPGATHTAKGKGTALCSPDLIHAYQHPLLGVIMNPMHADFQNDNMRMWEAEGEVVAKEGQLKCGVKTLTTLREIPVPVITKEQLVEFSIKVALRLYPLYSSDYFVQWASDWLDGNRMTFEEARWIIQGIDHRLINLTRSIDRFLHLQEQLRIEIAHNCLLVAYSENDKLRSGSVAQGAVMVFPSIDLISTLEEIQNKDRREEK